MAKGLRIRKCNFPPFQVRRTTQHTRKCNFPTFQVRGTIQHTRKCNFPTFQVRRIATASSIQEKMTLI